MLFMPILVYLLEEVMSPKVANFTCLLLITVGCIISYHILWSNNMSAGLFAPQDVLIFNLWVNKPYTKIHCVGLGIILARSTEGLQSLIK